MKTFIIVLTSVLFQVFCTPKNGSIHVSCNWSTEFLCGDKCVPAQGGKCFCGNSSFDLKTAFSSYCCNAKPCTKYQEDFAIVTTYIEPSRDDRFSRHRRFSNKISNGDVYCEDGKVQSMYTHCNNSCKQTAVFGMDSLSCNDHRCYLGIFACRGTPNCKDKSDLAQCTKEINCEEETDGAFQSCGQVPGATYQNSGCKKPESSTLAYFDCMNRMDKIETLFTRPIAFAKKKREVTNYNVLLEYDDEFVYCGSRNISFAQLSYVTAESPNEPCQLKSGNSIPIEKLYELFTHFSFEKSPELMKFHSEESEKQLNLQCFEAMNPFYCNSNSTAKPLCAFGHQVCDTIVNCPDGSDEDFDMCQDRFSELATIVCSKADTFNFNVTIKAIACDGIIECADGRDEMGCYLSNENIYITFGFILLAINVIAFILWMYIKGRLRLKRPGHQLTQKEFNVIHGIQAMQEKVSHWQGLDIQKCSNQAYYELELIQHNYDINSTICCMKNSLDMKTFNNVMEDRPSSEDGEFIKFIKKYSGAKFLSKGYEKLHFPQMIVSASSYVMDLTKDVLMVVQISLAQGGLKKILKHPQPYMAGLILFSIGTIVFPLILGSLQLMCQGPQFGRRTLFAWFIWICLQPFYPILVILKEKMLSQASKIYEVSASQYAKSKEQMTKYVGADLGLETMYQTAIQLVLVLLAKSETRTIQGLEVIFSDQNEVLGLNPTFIITISTMWSVFSCIRSFMKRSNIKREYSTWKSTLANFLFACFSITVRIISFVLYFTPALGLGNIHRFYQGEMFPFSAPISFEKSLKNLDQEFMYFGNAKPILWSKICRWNYTADRWNPIPPPLTLYTWFSTEAYFCVFIAILVLHPFAVMIGKKLSNPKPFSRLNGLDCLIHCICNTNTPYSMEDWDEEKGQVESHRHRQKLVFRETFVTICINFFFNLILLTPIILLSLTIFERKEILENSIGVLPKEWEAFRDIQLALGLGYGSLLLLTLGQILTFYLYNGSWHPLSRIVAKPKRWKYTEEFELKEMEPLALNEVI